MQKRKLWWQYVKHVYENCRRGVAEVSEDCSRNAHRELGLDWEGTNSCVSNSWTMNDKSDARVHNYLIEAERSYHDQYGTSLFPAIIINN